MTATTHELIEDYLRRLDTAAAELPPARRAELVAEIREHITVALAEGPDQGEAAVRTVLDRLGDPEDIAREAAGQAAPKAVTGATGGPLSAAKVLPGLGAALVLATLTLLAETAGWIALLIAAVLGWTLIRWPLRQKLLIVVVWPVGFGLVAASLAAAGDALGLLGAVTVAVGTIVLVHRDRKAA